MKQKKNFKWLVGLLCCAMMVMLISPITARADIGPKASVRIIFENMGDELCYGTLLSKKSSTGPSYIWDGDERYARHNENERYSFAPLDYETWKAFVEYEDSDGYYFLQEGWRVSETKKIEWTYYPPNSFKILLYYPETGNFVVSDIYERYAFDTYYTVDMDGVNIGSVEYEEALSSDAQIIAYRSYNYQIELVSLAARILITIIIEMAVALLFGFRKKKQLFLLMGVNTATQILLNVLLNVINYQMGQMGFVIFYILFELIVFALEAIVYCKRMKTLSEPQKQSWFYVVYALIANAISFGAGIYAAQLIPGIF